MRSTWYHFIIIFVSFSVLAQSQTKPKPSPAKAAISTRKALKGITAVVVRIVIDDFEKANPRIVDSDIKTIIELNLRTHGIKVVSDTEDAPWLSFTVDAIDSRDGSYSTDTEIGIVDSAFIYRETPTSIVRVQTTVTTWRNGYVGYVGYYKVKTSVEDSAKKLSDSFINQWLSDNQ